MFGWLTRLFSRRSPNVSGFCPKDRLIYRYWDGTKTVQADPLEVYKRLLAEHADIFIDSKVARNPYAKDAPEAQTRLDARIRKIFDIPALRGVNCEGTLTGVEVTDLLDDFYEFCGRVKKNSSQTPTSPTTTSLTTGSTWADPSPTPNGSASGSAGAAPSCDAPSPSSSAPASPSAPLTQDSTTSAP